MMATTTKSRWGQRGDNNDSGGDGEELLCNMVGQSWGNLPSPIIIDSGVCASTMFTTWCGHVPLTETPQSKATDWYRAANCQKIYQERRESCQWWYKKMLSSSSEIVASWASWLAPYRAMAFRGMCNLSRPPRHSIGTSSPKTFASLASFPPSSFRIIASIVDADWYVHTFLAWDKLPRHASHM